ncbi:MAG: FISUMP domain-containing protein, partial [Bacteroidota bacterium]
PNNGGLIPGYQWKVNGGNTGTNSPSFTYSPANGDQVSCLLNSSASCITGNPAASNIITMTVNTNLPAGVSISTPTNPFCPGTSVTFTATPVNGGSTPGYQWRVNASNISNAINAVFTYNPLPGDLVSCVMTSNLSCVTGNPVTSLPIAMIERAAPGVSFIACFDTITTVNAQPIKLKGGLPPGGQYSGPGVNSTTGIFKPSEVGTGLKTISYTYTNVYTCSAIKSKTILVLPNPSFTCGNNLTDIRDGKSYPTVLIGTQCWMEENLDFGFRISDLVPQTDNCTPEFYKNPNSGISNPKSVYQWDELMQYQTAEGSQGLCPPGWHVPTDAEWATLINFYQGNGSAGRPLQDTIINGFKALRSGVFYLNSIWSFMDFATIFWTSTSSGPTKAISHGMNLYNFSVSLYPASRGNAFGVRCLKD